MQTGWALHPLPWGTGIGTAWAGLLLAAPQTQPTLALASASSSWPLPIKKAVIWFGQSALGASLEARDLVPVLLVVVVRGHSRALCLLPILGRLQFPSGTALPGGAFISCGAGLLSYV